MIKKSWLLLFLFLAVLFLSLRTTHATLSNKFRVKQNLQLIGKPILHNGTILREHVATIANIGNHSARNMRVTLSISNGTILKILVKNQEHHPVLATPIKTGLKEIFVTDFAPNSILKIGIWTINFQDEVYITPRLYTEFYGGIAEYSTMDGINSDGINWNDSLVIVWKKFQERFIQSSVLYALSVSAEKYGIYGLYELNRQDKEMKWVFFVILALSLPFLLFISRVWLTIITIILISVLLWLFTNVTVNINWVIIFVYLAFLILMFTKSHFVRIVLVVTSTPMMIIYFLSIRLADFDCILHAIDAAEFLFCPPVSIPIGLVTGYSLSIFYLLIIELKKIYSSEYMKTHK